MKKILFIMFIVASYMTTVAGLYSSFDTEDEIHPITRSRSTGALEAGAYYRINSQSLQKRIYKLPVSMQQTIEPHSEEVVVLATAIPIEFECIKTIFSDITFHPIKNCGGARALWGILGRTKIIIAMTGKGIAPAASFTQGIIDKYGKSLKAFVFAGIAGSTDTGLQIGDVTIPREWKYLEGYLFNSISTPEGSKYVIREDVKERLYDDHIGPFFPIKKSPDGPFFVSEDLLNIAVNVRPIITLVNAEEMDATVLVGGIGVTNGTAFVDSRSVALGVNQILGGDSTDMESTAFVQVFNRNKEQGNVEIPCIIIRGISDQAGRQQTSSEEAVHNQIKFYRELAARNAGEVARAIIENFITTP